MATVNPFPAWFICYMQHAIPAPGKPPLHCCMGRSCGLCRTAGLAACRNVFLQPHKHGATELVSVHRLAIFDVEGNVVNIISQLDILRYALRSS